MSDPPVLEAKHLRVRFRTERGIIHALEDVSFSLFPKKTLALVGESGSGKSVTALSLLKLLPRDITEIPSGEILFEGTDILKARSKELQKIRGGKIAMIFQEPMTSLNPVYTAGFQITEAIRLHTPLTRREADLRSLSLLGRVGIADPKRCASSYPHELSGGMRQRVMIAMALSCYPKVLIADEPTTALDVTVQAQTLKLIEDLRDEFQMAVLLITHDLSVVSEYTDEVMVMYGGQVVEAAKTKELFQNTRHPYTKGLLASIPDLNRTSRSKLHCIDGTVPEWLSPKPGCRFAERCPQKVERCENEDIPLLSLESLTEKNHPHFSRCILHSSEKAPSA